MCSGPSDHATPLIKHNLTMMMTFHINALIYYTVSERTGEQTLDHFPVFLISKLSEKQSLFPAVKTFNSLLRNKTDMS